jgi:hypothetical protein
MENDKFLVLYVFVFYHVFKYGFIICFILHISLSSRRLYFSSYVFICFYICILDYILLVSSNGLTSLLLVCSVMITSSLKSYLILYRTFHSIQNF